ncbi:MAG: ribonuclease J [Candidatus Moraniibacteriota bacterium]|nr:MAG: ribonuclease J [Candidatus Moranbacteria bacterium]
MTESSFVSPSSPSSGAAASGAPRRSRNFPRRRPFGENRQNNQNRPTSQSVSSSGMSESHNHRQGFPRTPSRENRQSESSRKPLDLGSISSFLAEPLRNISFERDRKFVVSSASSSPRQSTPLSPRSDRQERSAPSFHGKGRQANRPARAQHSGGQRLASRPGEGADDTSEMSKKTARKFAAARREPKPFIFDRNEGGTVPPIGKGLLRVIPIGGQEEVGRNMTVFEYENDIVIVDMGVQWPEADMPGIDYIVPNISYLKGKEKNIRGVIFTHGHLDHIGAAPILLKELNYPPIIGRDLTIALIKRKVEDHEQGSTSRLKIVPIRSLTDAIQLGAFRAKFFEVEHSIMDAVGVVLETPEGSIIHMGDWTIGKDPINPKPITYTHLADLPKPTILMLESLGALKSGDPPSEREVHQNLKNLLETAPGRIILATFASQVQRIAYIIEYAERIGKKVALEGYSMKMNMEIAKELGYLKAKKETIITVNDIHKYPDNQVLVICTGAQGELNAALSKIVTDNHRFIKLQKKDTIVFSSSVIPGNERSIQRLKDNLYRKCDNVLHSETLDTQGVHLDIHIGGHSTAKGIEEMLRQVRPTFFLPVYANHYFLKEAAKIAGRIGFPAERVFVLDNGGILEVQKGEAKVFPKKADSSYVFIDGLGVGDIGHVVLRDRQMLAQDGMIAITVVIDSKTKKIIGSIQITSRGFIHVKENFDLVNETKRKVTKIVKDSTSRDTSLDWNLVRNNIRDTVGQFLFMKTERRPMVLPVIVEA